MEDAGGDVGGAVIDDDASFFPRVSEVSDVPESMEQESPTIGELLKTSGFTNFHVFSLYRIVLTL
jgi:hypothetical protein